MFEREQFIGDWCNTSGGYPHTLLDGLSHRMGSGPELYKFRTAFADHSGYYITHPDVVREISNRLSEASGAETKTEASEHLDELEEYLYRVIVDKFGAMVLVKAAQQSIRVAYEDGSSRGRKEAQKDMRKALGIKDR